MLKQVWHFARLIVSLQAKSDNMTDFKELGLKQELLQAIAEQGYEHPMPVQEQVIPSLQELRWDLPMERPYENPVR